MHANIPAPFSPTSSSPLLLFCPLQESSRMAYRHVELRVLSNWGHMTYTCIYRFRVHGKMADA